MSPVSQFRRVDLDQLFLPFVEKVLAVIAACNARGEQYHATAGYRTFKEQLALWCEGRTVPGPQVTNAGPGESAHNFGLAVDLCHDAHLDVPGLQPDWRAEQYLVLGDETRRAGLVWGGDFHGLSDRPHVQWPGYVTAAQLAPLKTIYLAAKDAPLSAVFAHLSQGVS